MKVQEPHLHIFIDEAELLSQSIISRSRRNNRGLYEDFVNLWVTSAIRGFSLGVAPQKTSTLLVEGIDSFGYTKSIQNSGNPNLGAAYAQSAAEKEADIATSQTEDDRGEGNSTSIALIAVAIIFVAVGLISACTYLHYKRPSSGLSCLKYRQQQKASNMDIERGPQSPESVGAASHEQSIFSFDDTTTAGTQGLMRFISSFSRSRDSASPNYSTQSSPSHGSDDNEDQSAVEELGTIPSLDKEEDEIDEEPHPLASFIPPMVVYDCIDKGNDLPTEPSNSYSKQRMPSLVPSVRVEACSSFIAALANRDRPSATSELPEYQW